MARHRKESKGWYGVRTLVCRQCGQAFADTRVRGRKPRYCSDACKQKAWRESKKE